MRVSSGPWTTACDWEALKNRFNFYDFSMTVFTGVIREIMMFEGYGTIPGVLPFGGTSSA